MWRRAYTRPGATETSTPSGRLLPVLRGEKAWRCVGAFPVKMAVKHHSPTLTDLLLVAGQQEKCFHSSRRSFQDLPHLAAGLELGDDLLLRRRCVETRLGELLSFKI